MTVHRVDDVIGSKGLAIMEFNTLADLEGPFCGSVVRQNFFSQFRLITQIFGQSGERAVIHTTAEIVDRRCEQCRIECIVRAMLVTSEDNAAPTLRRCSPGIGDTGKHCASCSCCCTGCHEIGHEFAPCGTLLDHRHVELAISWRQLFENRIVTLEQGSILPSCL